MGAVNKLSSAHGWELSVLARVGGSGSVLFNYTDILFRPQVEAFWDSKVSPWSSGVATARWLSPETCAEPDVGL